MARSHQCVHARAHWGRSLVGVVPFTNSLLAGFFTRMRRFSMSVAAASVIRRLALNLQTVPR